MSTRSQTVLEAVHPVVIESATRVITLFRLNMAADKSCRKLNEDLTGGWRLSSCGRYLQAAAYFEKHGLCKSCRSCREKQCIWRTPVNPPHHSCFQNQQGAGKAETDRVISHHQEPTRALHLVISPCCMQGLIMFVASRKYLLRRKTFHKISITMHCSFNELFIPAFSYHFRIIWCLNVWHFYL